MHEQLKLDTPLLPIIGNSDYDRYRAELNLVDDIRRGCNSPEVRKLLETTGIFNAVCPRSIGAYDERSKNPRFGRHQKRRAQTEGRVAILNDFSGNPMLQKGFDHRAIHMGLSVLSHNLRKLAQLRAAQEARPPNQAAA